MKRILIIAAHPDDEIIGVGGTVAKLKAEGNEIYALILGEGQTSRFDARELADLSLVEKLHQDTLAAAQIIGYKEVFFENFPDNRFDSVSLLDVVKKVEQHIRELSPEVIFTHHGGDLNIDHQVTNHAVLTASRPIGNYSVQDIYAFETLSSTEWNFSNKEEQFCPNLFVEINEQSYEKKCEAMRAYASELCTFPHPRSIEMFDIQMKKWGSTVGKKYAEAFEVIRSVR